MGKRPSHILRDTVVSTVPDCVLFREQHLNKLKQSIINDNKITKLLPFSIFLIASIKRILTSFNVK